MIYEKGVTEKIQQFNEVLLELGQPELQRNPLFSINQDRNYEHYTEVKINHPEKLFVLMVFSNDGFTVNMDRSSEIYDFSSEFMQANPKATQNIMKGILTASVEIRYYGPSLTKFIFHPMKGEIYRSVKVYTGLLLWPFAQIKKFNPILQR